MKGRPYILPEIDVLEMEFADMLALSSVSYSSSYANDEYEVLSNSRRGEWGDLWSAE